MLLERNQTSPNDFVQKLTRGSVPKRIACWVASTERADWIVQVAKSLSNLGQGQCVAVMCLDSPSHNKPLTPEVIGRAGTELDALYGNDTQTMVLPGHPVVEIRRYARTQNIDLIVMGEQALAVERTYGERLLDDAPCTVMVLALPQQTDNPTKNRPAQTKSGQTHKR